MFFVFHKKQILSFACLLSVVLLGSLMVPGREAATASSTADVTTEPIVIIDPGHGGEDGGAVAADGTVESAINLEIGTRLEGLLYFMGYETDMTRDADISIYTDGAETLREKKVSDLHNRVDLVNGYEAAILLSIHQNSLPSSTATYGAQVFFNGGEGADTLAQSIQNHLNTVINRDRPKECKAIDSSVFLMNHINCTGVLVECGFLSNVTEASLLKTSEHQKKLTVAIAAGFSYAA